MLSTGLCHTEVLGMASAWGRDLIASTLIMQLWLNPLFPSDSQGGVQNVGLARSQKTFCFLAFSPSCSDFGQAASSQCASLMPVYSSGIIFILVLMTSSFFKVLLICQTKAGEHEASEDSIATWGLSEIYWKTQTQMHPCSMTSKAWVSSTTLGSLAQLLSFPDYIQAQLFSTWGYSPSSCNEPCTPLSAMTPIKEQFCRSFLPFLQVSSSRSMHKTQHDSCFRWKLFLERRRELNKEVNWESRETASTVWKLQGREFLQHYPTHVFIIAEVPTA